MSSQASSDEGEIRDIGKEKANKSLLQNDGPSVDRHDRPRSRYSRSPAGSGSSQDRRSTDRSRSPYRAPRPGDKRSRDEDHYDRNRDTRQFRVHYEDRSSDYRRSRVSYEDMYSGDTSSRGLDYDDRDYRHQDKRHRTRSRSPYRANRDVRSEYTHRDSNRYEKNRGKGQANGRQEKHGQNSREQSVSKRGQDPLPTDLSQREAKFDKGYSKHSENGVDNNQDRFKSTKTEQPAHDDPEPEPELSEAAQIELRRRRREALKAKYRGSATPSLRQQALHSTVQSPATPGMAQDGRSRTFPSRPLTGSADRECSASPALSTPTTPGRGMSPATPDALLITSDQDLANSHADTGVNGVDDGPSAADYDPVMDMREDRNRINHQNELPSANYDETKPSIEQDILLPADVVARSSQDIPKVSKDDFDMFAAEDEDDEDDMFADSPVNKRTKRANSGERNVAVAVPIPEARTLDIGMLDNWDDPEGYYKIILGELLKDRYHVQATLGQGMFSGVVRAIDIVTKRTVAIKLIRNNEIMRKAGVKEIEILQRLKEADPDDKKHIIILERTFEHKGHLCMVFEALHFNLRDLLKKFGRDIGLNLTACRAYAHQMFLALSLMKKCNIIHADLKPDNMLVNDSRNVLKVCDLGSASDASDNEITPYLVSRFYRAPEIILGMPYDFAIDMWSIGCTLYEMYTGKILFTGRTNNQMLRSIMECRGPFTRKMLNQAQFAAMHFEDDMRFRSMEQDKVTGRDIVKLMALSKPVRDLRTRLLSASSNLSVEEMKDLNLFTDLLDRCLALNPSKRLSPNEALKHPFLSRPLK